MIENEEKFTFETYTGKELLTKKKDMLYKMTDVIESHSTRKVTVQDSMLYYLDDSAHVICMLEDKDVLGFSWMTLSKETKEAELSWFYADKHRVKGLDAKKLFDKSVEYCQSNEIETLRFNCSDAWIRVKDVDRLMTSFGYTNSDDKRDFDVSIDILEK